MVVVHFQGVLEGHRKVVLGERHREVQNCHWVSEVPYWSEALAVPLASEVPSPPEVPSSVLQTPLGVLPCYPAAAASLQGPKSSFFTI